MDRIQKNIELKRNILNYCYNEYHEGRPKVTEIELITFLNIRKNGLPLLESLTNEKYLKRHTGLVFASKKSMRNPPPRPDYSYSISSEGIKLIENQAEFNRLFPIQIINNTTNNNINMVQNNVQYNINLNFQQVYQKIETGDFERKDELLMHVKNIENELKKDKKDSTSIWNSLMFIKSLEFHASWLFPEIMEIILKSLLLGQF